MEGNCGRLVEGNGIESENEENLPPFSVGGKRREILFLRAKVAKFG